MRIVDVFVLGIDLVLFTYFTQIALNTTNLTIRIVACFAMTVEIFFIRQHIKLNRLLTQKEKIKKYTVQYIELCIFFYNI